MWEFIKEKGSWVVSTFHANETIVWSRLQILLGSAWFALSSADLTPLHIDPKYMMGWMMFNGFVSEMLRRNREEFKDDGDKH